MKTFSPGLSDSIASVISDPRPCPHCDSSSHIAGGLCVGCLLEAGLDPIDESESDALTDLLAETNLPDQNWRLGNYEILEEIGRGGMGVIYRARQRHSRRIVAVKRVLSYHSDSRETLARFRREAQAAASLDHPNILPIYEVSESEDGLPFFSMKFAPGGTLQQVAPALRTEPRQCVAIVAKIARAVQYAHSRGILHRDLKPGNILLDGRGEPLVSDFGLAKWLDTASDLTRTLTIFGTPGYIAPEQASSAAAELKPTADVYSLGAILFDLLAGRPPFLGAHALSVIRQASESPAPKLRSLSKLADRDLETICVRCLEREPTARYRSAYDLAEDLERWLEGRTIIARRALPPTRIWRWSRRNPKLAASIIASLTLGVAAFTWAFQNQKLGLVLQRTQLSSRSITVLPFLDLENIQPNAARADSTAQALEAELSKLTPARVAAARDSRSWLANSGDLRDIQEANHDLKSRAILTGSERLINGKLRLSLRLINAANGDVLYVQSLETAPGPGVTAAIVRAIAPALDSILTATDWSRIAFVRQDPAMRNPVSREFMISGRQLMFRGTIEDFDASIRCVRKALEIEPKSPLAHTYLSSTQVARVHFVPNGPLLEEAEIEAKEALRLDPSLSEAHRALAAVLFHKNRFTEALEEQLRSIEAGGPEERGASFIGWTLNILGRPHQALAWLEMAKRWTSIPGSHDAFIGDSWMLLNDDTNAEAAYRRAIDLRPESPDGWIGLCYLRLLQGDVFAARRIWQDNQARSKSYEGTFNDNPPDEILPRIEFFSRNYRGAEPLYAELARKNRLGGIASYGGMSNASALGRIRQAIGDKAGAQSILQESLAKELEVISSSQNTTALYRIAAIEACLGNQEDALKHLQDGVNLGWIDYRSLQIDPRFDTLADAPRFHEIISGLRTKVAELRRQTGQPITMASNGEQRSP
jgi:serine/threonine protein kinase/Flp pilus assembly protein TadD